MIAAMVIEEERKTIGWKMKYNTWVVQHEDECITKTWLDCETKLEADSKIVTKLNIAIIAYKFMHLLVHMYV